MSKHGIIGGSNTLVHGSTWLLHFANVAPDVLVGDLPKTSRASQLFTVFGQPDVAVTQQDGISTVELRGVDIYDPVTGKVYSARGADVVAWFLDTDYDGKTLHVCQAFFRGNGRAWEQLQRALKAQIAPEVFAKMRGTRSFRAWCASPHCRESDQFSG